MAFSMAGNGSPTAQINITPLIDVLLVLIIVFMVVVSMSQEKGLDAEIPQPAKDRTSQPQTPDETIVVQLVWSGSDQSPTLKINQDNVSWKDLDGRLQDIFKRRAERVAFVKGDDEVDFAYVADVIDIAHAAGVQKVGLLTVGLLTKEKP
jgi:biopolymer transport protein TolR